jgi:RHS repeat-associated protein
MKKWIAFLIISLLVAHRTVFACGGSGPKTNGARVSFESGCPQAFADPKATNLYLRDISDSLFTENRKNLDITIYPGPRSMQLLINLIPKIRGKGNSEVALGISLNYNSMEGSSHRWYYDFESSALFFNQGGMTCVNISDPRGNTLMFFRNTDGTYTPANKTDVQFSTAYEEPSGGAFPYFIWRQKNGVKYYYEGLNQIGSYVQYRISKITDRNGNSINYEYANPENVLQINALKDDAGRRIVIEYNEIGEKTALIDPAGQVYKITPSMGDAPLEIQYPDGSSMSFSYTLLSQLITAIKTPRGFHYGFSYEHRQLSEIVDPEGKTITLTDAGIAYLRFVTDKEGNTWKYQYDHVYGLRELTALSVPQQPSQKFDWTAPATKLDLITTYTDFNGNPIKYEYDANIGEVVKRTDAMNNSTIFTYDPTYCQLLTVTDATGSTVQRILDTKGNVIEIIDPLNNHTKYEYDNYGNIVKTTDPMGNETSCEYDEYGNPIKITDPAGFTTEYTYDVMSRVTTQRNPLGHTTSYLYDTLGNPTKTIYPDGAVKIVAYDECGNKIKEIDENGNETLFAYDWDNRLIATTDAYGYLAQIKYSPRGYKIEERSKLGKICTWEYDALGRKIKETDSTGNPTQFGYEGNSGNAMIEGGNFVPTKITDPLGYTTSMENNGNYKNTKTTDPSGGQSVSTYDANNNLRFITDPNGLKSELQYDLKNRKVKTIDPAGNVSSLSYNALDDVIEKTDANGNSQKYYFNSRRLLEKAEDAKGQSTVYYYDAARNKISMMDARKKITNYTYDSRNRLVKVVTPIGTETMYSYDSVGNKTRQIDADGLMTEYEYDRLNRIISEKLPSGELCTYHYDADSNIIETKKNNSSTIYVYDAMGRVISVNSSTFPLITYAYDAMGHRTQLSVAGQGTQIYEYDPSGAVTKIVALQGQSTSFTYDPGKRRTSMTQGNRIKTTFKYDAAGYLLQKKCETLNLLYTYDKIGNILTARDDAGMTHYSYDKTYQLTQVRYPDSSKEDFVYDETGNRIKKIRHSEGTRQATEYRYNDFNQLLEEQTGKKITTYKYNKQGSLIEKVTPVDTTVYTHDGQYRLTEIKQDSGQSVKFQYDAEGRRIQRTYYPNIIKKPQKREITKYLYDGLNGIANLSETNGVNSTYCTDFQLDTIISSFENGNTTYYHTDHAGTVRTLTNSRRQETESYRYEAFGQQINSTQTKNRYTFTGRETESEFGLMYYRYRYYDPQAGRFISPDPFTRGPDDPRISYQNNTWASIHGKITQYMGGHTANDTNRYIYVKNNPVNCVDPLGLEETHVVFYYPSDHGFGNGTANGKAFAATAAAMSKNESAKGIKTIIIPVSTMVEGAKIYQEKLKTGEIKAENVKEILLMGHGAPGIQQTGKYNILQDSMEKNAVKSIMNNTAPDATAIMGGCNTANLFYGKGNDALQQAANEWDRKVMGSVSIDGTKGEVYYNPEKGTVRANLATKVFHPEKKN